MSGRKKQMAEINLVPYIDVMLVLLVIFMITAPLTEIKPKQSVTVNLPKTVKTTIIKNKQLVKPIEVIVKKSGTLFLSVEGKLAQPVNYSQLEQIVKTTINAIIEKKKTPTVVIRADKETKYGLVMKAMGYLKKAGAASVGLVTEQEDK